MMRDAICFFGNWNMAVRLGFIGFGIMGERLLRAGLAHDSGTLAVTGAFDPAPGTADRLRAIDPALHAFASADAVIAASDVLHIASPPLSHLAYLAACAKAGKAALCEKPLATDVAAATAAVRDLQEAGLRAAVNFPFASSFAVDHLNRWMAEGVVGTPERIDIELAFASWPRAWQMDAVSWLDGPAEGGFAREVGSHFLFLSRRLFGPLQLERATCSYPEPGRSERAVTAQLRAGLMPVSLSGGVGTTTKDDHNTWTLTGSTGRVRLRDWSIAEREIDGIWQAPRDAVPNDIARPLVLRRQLDKVIAMTRGEFRGASEGQPHNLATLADALDVQTKVEAILRSGRQT
jgi:predicted dehydrogenase